MNLPAVSVPANVRRVHIVGEKLGLWIAGPVCIYAATYKSLPKWLRAALLVTGVGTMAVDSWLLKQVQNES